jgi:hypothetical protein
VGASHCRPSPSGCSSVCNVARRSRRAATWAAWAGRQQAGGLRGTVQAVCLGLGPGPEGRHLRRQRRAAQPRNALEPGVVAAQRVDALLGGGGACRQRSVEGTDVARQRGVVGQQRAAVVSDSGAGISSAPTPRPRRQRVGPPGRQRRGRRLRPTHSRAASMALRSRQVGGVAMAVHRHAAPHRSSRPAASASGRCRASISPSAARRQVQRR